MEPFNSILDGKFFSVLSKDSDGKVKAECLKCKGVFSGAVNQTSNFRKHLMVSALIPILYIKCA